MRYSRSLSSSAAAFQKDLYEVLGVDKGADKKIIKKKYFELAKKYHPDQNPNNSEATKKFQEVSQAYEVLGDDEKRKKYDQFGFSGIQDDAEHANSQAQNARAEEVFRSMMNEMFGGGGGARGFGDIFGNGSGGRENDGEGEDVSLRMKVSFDEAVRGMTKKVEYNAMKSCPTCKGSGSSGNGKPEYNNCSSCKGTGYKVTMQRSPLGMMQFQSICNVCHGQGKKIKNPCKTCEGHGRVNDKTERSVNIPAGIDSGQTIRVVGGGDVGARGKKSGDLFVSIEVTPSTQFNRVGTNVSSETKIPLTTALLGGVASVKGVMGEEFEVKVPIGTNTGDVLRLKRKGIPVINSGNRGDHLVQFVIDIPTSLTDRQKELLKDFQVEEDKKKGIFNQTKTSSNSTSSTSSDAKSNTNNRATA